MCMYIYICMYRKKDIYKPIQIVTDINIGLIRCLFFAWIRLWVKPLTSLTLTRRCCSG